MFNGKILIAESSTSSNVSDTEDVVQVFVEENSMLRFILGNFHLNVSSSAVHRVYKVFCCGYNEYHYQPYSKASTGNMLISTTCKCLQFTNYR